MAFPTSNQFGSFVPTSNVWDVSQIFALEDESPELKELLVRLYQNLNLMSISLNTRDAGYYDTSEFVNGQLWFPNPLYNSSTQTAPAYRQDYRKVFNIPTSIGIPLIGLTIPHGITLTPKTTFTRIYGTANDTINQAYLPLPFVSTTGSGIELFVNGPNIIIIPQVALPNINQIYVVLEYLQS